LLLPVSLLLNTKSTIGKKRSYGDCRAFDAASCGMFCFPQWNV
jgi:hypothetical protein